MMNRVRAKLEQNQCQLREQLTIGRAAENRPQLRELFPVLVGRHEVGQRACRRSIALRARRRAFQRWRAAMRAFSAALRKRLLTAFRAFLSCIFLRILLLRLSCHSDSSRWTIRQLIPLGTLARFRGLDSSTVWKAAEVSPIRRMLQRDLAEKCRVAARCQLQARHP